MLSFASGSSQPEQFLLIYSSLGFGTSVPMPQSLQIRISPWFSLLRWVFNPCVDSVFSQQIPATAFTTTSFPWWPGATKLISVAVLPFVPPHRPSVSPILSAADRRGGWARRTSPVIIIISRWTACLVIGKAT